MLFEKKFKIVEIRDGGVVITHHCCGKKKDVNKDIENFKQHAKNFQMFGDKGMVVWV